MTERTAKNEKTDTKDFKTLIREHREKHGSKLAQAMSAVVRSHPEAHAAFLNSGETLDKSEADADKGFLELVDQCQALHQCSRVVAMQKTVRAYPNAHRAFIEQSKQR